MIKRNKIKLIISSIIILIPILLGVFGGKILPEEVAIHWGFDGKADGWATPAVAFFVIPVILLVVHWVCMIVTDIVDKDVKQNKKITEIVFWIIPAISLVANGTMFAIALGAQMMLQVPIFILLGLTFIIVGNYMPKSVRNRTMGIKIKWALSNDENWQATHRFGGKLYVALGFILLLAIPLPMMAFPFIMIPIILAATLIPIIYSYRFYKKQIVSGRATKEEYEKEYTAFCKSQKSAKIVAIVITALVVVLLPLIMFTGKIETTLGDASMTVKATFNSTLTVNYDDIDTVEYRTEAVKGERLVGFASAKLLVGSFRNDEFGIYTRYTYTKDMPCIVIKSGDKIFVISDSEEQKVKEIYDILCEKIGKEEKE